MMRSKRAIRVTLVIAIFAFLWIVTLIGPRSPSGRYYEKYIGAEGHVCYALYNGKMDLVCEDQEYRSRLAEYRRTTNGWFFLEYSSSNSTIISTNQIKPYWWGISMMDRFLWRCPEFWKHKIPASQTIERKVRKESVAGTNTATSDR